MLLGVCSEAHHLCPRAPTLVLVLLSVISLLTLRVPLGHHSQDHKTRATRISLQQTMGAGSNNALNPICLPVIWGSGGGACRGRRLPYLVCWPPAGGSGGGERQEKLEGTPTGCSWPPLLQPGPIQAPPYLQG